MKSLLIILFIFVSLGSMVLAQSINQKDASGKRTGKWVIYQKGTNLIYEEGTFVAGRKEGLWKRYYSDGKNIQIEAIYKNNRPMGSYSKFYVTGKVKERGHLALNLYKDSLIRYFENGKIEYAGNFNQTGKEQGKIKYFFENGNLEY